MVNFIEFPVFDGVSGDLRSWISWLEAFFVREKFTKLEKMNLAQSLLEGEAESWFYRSQKIVIFYSWKELKFNLWLRFGDFADSDILESNSSMSTIKEKITTEKKSIWETETEALVPMDTIPVVNWTESRESSSAQELIEKDESQEASLVQVEGDTTMFQILDSLEEESITPNQVPVSTLEHSLQIHKESPNVCEHSQDVVDCEHQSEMLQVSHVKEMEEFPSQSTNDNGDNGAHKLFDQMPSKEKRIRHRKGWKFKFKPSSKRTLQCMRLKNLRLKNLSFKKQAHKSRVLYQLRWLHDPCGKKDEHFDEIFDTEVDIGKVQRTQMDIVTESVITAPDNVAPYTDVIPNRQNGNAACDAAIDALDGTATWIVVSLPANKISIGCKWVSFAVHALFLHQISWLLQLILDDLKSHMKHKWKSKHLQAVFDLQNNLKRFAEGEIYVQLQESVRGWDVFLVQPTCPPANENLMELLVMIDTCLRAASGNTFTAVIPYFGYARADRKTLGCEYIAAYHEWHRWKHKTASLQGLLAFVVFTLVNFYSTVTAVTSISQSMGLAQHGGEEILWMLLFWSTYFKKQKFGKNWWYKFKHGFWQRECGKELLDVEVVVAETMVDVRYDDIGRREFLIHWRNHDFVDTSWMLSKDFVDLYPTFKLEDKLVFGEESIDTIQGCDDVAKC